jgi:hypothetical protein
MNGATVTLDALRAIPRAFIHATQSGAKSGREIQRRGFLPRSVRAVRRAPLKRASSRARRTMCGGRSAPGTVRPYDEITTTVVHAAEPNMMRQPIAQNLMTFVALLAGGMLIGFGVGAGRGGLGLVGGGVAVVLVAMRWLHNR